MPERLGSRGLLMGVASDWWRAERRRLLRLAAAAGVFVIGESPAALSRIQASSQGMI